MSNVVEFTAKDKEHENQQEGAELYTLSRDRLINIFFPGLTEGETLVVTTTIGEVCNVIRSANHQVAVWNALCQLDNMRRNMHATATGCAGAFGNPLIQLQLGLVHPD
jgi:hypothetical protein